MYSRIITAGATKIGDMCILRFGGVLANSIAGTNATICTLDSRLRPSGDTSCFMWGNYSTVNYPIMAVGTVKQDGTVITAFGSATLSGAIYVITSCFVTTVHPAP